MSSLQHVDCTLTYQIEQPTELIFQIEVAHHVGQQILSEQLIINPPMQIDTFQRQDSANRLFRMSVQPGPLEIKYLADVMLDLPAPNPELRELPIAQLPSDVLFYLSPSRYCESDLIYGMVQRTFGHLPPGFARVQAVCDWIHDNIVYVSGSTNATTSAREILVHRAGVCRDFAHLGIAICRALNIPARFVVGYMDFHEASPDFHAIFEVFLEHQWVLFDATRMGDLNQFVRIGTGTDAKDVPFATYYGQVKLTGMQPLIHLVEPQQG